MVLKATPTHTLIHTHILSFLYHIILLMWDALMVSVLVRESGCIICRNYCASFLVHLEFKALIMHDRFWLPFFHTVAEPKRTKRQVNEACGFPLFLLRHPGWKSYSGWDQRIKALSGTFPESGSGGLFVFVLFSLRNNSLQTYSVNTSRILVNSKTCAPVAWVPLQTPPMAAPCARSSTSIMQRNYFRMGPEISKSLLHIMETSSHRFTCPHLPQQKWWMAVNNWYGVLR